MAFTATASASLETWPVWNARKAPLLSVGFSASPGAVQGAHVGHLAVQFTPHGPSLGLQGAPAAPGAAVGAASTEVGAATAITGVPSAGDAHNLTCVCCKVFPRKHRNRNY